MTDINTEGELVPRWIEVEHSPQSTEEYTHREYKRSDVDSHRYHQVTVNNQAFEFLRYTDRDFAFVVDTTPPEAPSDAHDPRRRWHITVQKDGGGRKLKAVESMDMWNGTFTQWPEPPDKLARALEIATGLEVL